MKLKYEKTPLDKTREIADLRSNPIMRFLKHQNHFKFNVGDILVKQRRLNYSNEWETEVISGVNTAKKFMYVFENELGIGYVKQLRVDGSGFTTTLVCTANFDPDNTRFQLDPDFVDHILIGDEDFEYNKEYLSKKAYREDAIKKNMKLVVKTRSLPKRIEWLTNLKKGDEFWLGDSMDDLYYNKYKVKKTFSNENPLRIEVVTIEHKIYHNISAVRTLDEDYFAYRYVSTKQPFSLEDPLCDRPR